MKDSGLLMLTIAGLLFSGCSSTNIPNALQPAAPPGPSWHAGLSCGGVCTGTPAAGGLAGFASGTVFDSGQTPPPSFEVSAPPVGTILYSLPNGAESINVGGQRYYTFAGTMYRPFFGNNGVYYEVVP
jgi:hypothetical protein